MTIPNFTIPPVQSKGNSGTNVIDRKMIQDTARKIPNYLDPVCRPSPKPVKIPMAKIPGSLADIDPELNTDFEDNSPFQESAISETYKRPDKSYFQKPQELESLINTGRLVQMFLQKEADIDKILKIIQRKVLKETHLPVTIKEIQAGYIVSSYFKDLYLYLAQNELPDTKTSIQNVETLVKRYILLDFLLFRIVTTSEKETAL